MPAVIRQGAALALDTEQLEPLYMDTQIASKPGALRVFLFIAHRFNGQTFFWGRSTMAERLGLSSKTVERYELMLAAGGHIRFEAVKGRGRVVTWVRGIGDWTVPSKGLSSPTLGTQQSHLRDSALPSDGTQQSLRDSAVPGEGLSSPISRDSAVPHNSHTFNSLDPPQGEGRARPYADIHSAYLDAARRFNAKHRGTGARQRLATPMTLNTKSIAAIDDAWPEFGDLASFGEALGALDDYNPAQLGTLHALSLPGLLKRGKSGQPVLCNIRDGHYDLDEHGRWKRAETQRRRNEHLTDFKGATASMLADLHSQGAQ